MMYITLLTEIEELIDENEINQFDEVDLELIKKILDKVNEE